MRAVWDCFAACDVSVAGLTSSFALTKARLGLSPAVISLTVLARLTDRAASRYYLTGDRFDAAEAERIGLVTIAADNPDEAVAGLAASFRKCSPQGLAASNQLTTHRIFATFDSDAERLIDIFASLFSSEDAQRASRRFWSGGHRAGQSDHDRAFAEGSEAGSKPGDPAGVVGGRRRLFGRGGLVGQHGDGGGQAGQGVQGGRRSTISRPARTSLSLRSNT